MTAPYRPLRVESCEDRALPSALFSIGHAEWPVASFASTSSMNESTGRSTEGIGRDSLDAIARAFRGQDFQNFIARAFEHNAAWNSGITVFVVVYFQSAERASQPVAQETQADSVLSRGHVTRSAEGGLDEVPTDRGKAVNVSPPTIAIPPNVNAVASNQSTGTNATSTAANPQPVDSQARGGVSGTPGNTGLGGPLIFLGVDPEEAPPADEPVPPAPLTIPPPIPVVDQIPAAVISAASFAGNAVTGVLPFNLAELESGARELLSRVGNLDVELPDSVGGGEYLWLATAALVTGGVASTIRGNRARWADRRTVGFDSVLAKWGERNGGRFN